MPKITPFLWFDNQAEEAAQFYVSVFKNAQLGPISRYDAAGAEVSGKEAGTAMTVEFTLDDQPFTALNGGPVFTFTEAISFVVHCQDQAEIDHYWEKLSAHPESEQCGWLKDKFGVSWQIIPANLGALLANEAAMKAMLNMKKLDIAALETARDCS